LSLINVDNSWSLFLDRDGVINEKLDNDYVKNWGEFKFKEGALQAIAGLGKIFGRVFVVTNQRGVGLGLMTEEGLNEIHDRMHSEVIGASGRIDKIYYCTVVDNCAECRKPNIGMGLKAKSDFPEIEFSKSIMVGDSISDIMFAKNLGMKQLK
jgi:histidinol-phosphate phosphatase family protein